MGNIGPAPGFHWVDGCPVLTVVTRGSYKGTCFSGIPQPGDPCPLDSRFIAQKPTRRERIGNCGWNLDIPYVLRREFDRNEWSIGRRYTLAPATPWLWWVSIVLAVLIAVAWFAPASFGQTAPATQPFVIGVWQQPASSAAKWKALGVNTIYGHNTEGGRITKAQWEDQVASNGEFFINEPGADVVAEAKQPYRLGFNQLDEPDSSLHQGTPGNRLADLKAIYERCHATGKPVYANFIGSGFDNVYYDGRRFRTDIHQDRPYWHNASDGGYFAWADVPGFDYHLWTSGRAGMFNITRRLMDRAHDWSGGKPIFVYVETCTQGKGIPFTADDYERQVWTITDYAKLKGYKLGGIIYFTQKVYPGWGSFDMTAPDVIDRMKVVNAKLVQMYGAPSLPPVPSPVDPLIELKARNAELTVQIDVLNAALDAQAIVNRDLKATAVDLTARNQAAARLLMGAATQPSQP